MPKFSKRPLESFSRPWIGVFAIITIVAVLVGLVSYAGLGVGKTRYRGISRRRRRSTPATR